MFDVTQSKVQQAMYAAVVSALALILYLTVPQVDAIAQISNLQLRPIELTSRLGQAFTPQERIEVVRRILENPNLAPITRGNRVRALEVVPYISEKESGQPAGKRLASAILFNYAQGRAYRVLLDPATGNVTRQEALPGRPQPSEEEREEARQIVQTDAKHAQLLQQGGILEGGFAVDGPTGSNPVDRFIQLQILTADRSRFLRVVTVDLTTKQIVASSPHD
jgi:hypothetical protein